MGLSGRLMDFETKLDAIDAKLSALHRKIDCAISEAQIPTRRLVDVSRRTQRDETIERRIARALEQIAEAVAKPLQGPHPPLFTQPPPTER